MKPKRCFLEPKDWLSDIPWHIPSTKPCKGDTSKPAPKSLSGSPPRDAQHFPWSDDEGRDWMHQHAHNSSTLLDQFLRCLKVAGHAGATIVDLGAGRGNLTHVLGKRKEKYRIVAIEFDSPSRERIPVTASDRVRAWASSGRGMGNLRDGEVDAVIAGQWFRWVANAQSLQEIYRVLKPGGHFGMICNVLDDYHTRTAMAAPTITTPTARLLRPAPIGTPRTKLPVGSLHSRQKRKVNDNPDLAPPGWSDLLSTKPTPGLEGCDLVSTRFCHQDWKGFLESQKPGAALFQLPLRETKIPWKDWKQPMDMWNRSMFLPKYKPVASSQVSIWAHQCDVPQPSECIDCRDIRMALDRREVHGIAVFLCTRKIGMVPEGPAEAHNKEGK